MISYERIDRSEGIDFNKTKDSIKCMICNYHSSKDLNISPMFVMHVMILVWV